MCRECNGPRVLFTLMFGIVLMLVPALLWAQGSGGRGSISGTLTDPSGAVLPGVSVTALEHCHRSQRERHHILFWHLRHSAAPPGYLQHYLPERGIQN